MAEFADWLHLRQLPPHCPVPRRRHRTRLIEDLLQRAAARKKPVTLDVIHGNPARSLYLRLRLQAIRAGRGQDPNDPAPDTRLTGTASAVRRVRLALRQVAFGSARLIGVGLAPSWQRAHYFGRVDPVWFFLARGRSAAKDPVYEPWILLDFLGFSRPN